MVTVQDQFAKFPKQNRVIATTYNFDQQIIKELICPRRGVHERSIVITDRSCFAESIPDQDFYNQGLSHYVYPAYKIKGAFHPKIAIGIDEGLVKLLVGSHNLTENGAKYNLEITGFYEIPITEDNKPVIDEMARFLHGLTSCIESDITAKKSILDLIDYISDLNPTGMEWKTEDPFFFIHSFKKSILEQVMEQIPKINSATICVPTHSENKSFIEETAYSFGNELKFLVDPKNFSVNENAKKAYKKCKIEGLEIEDNRNLHAKVYVFHTEKGDWVLYGSPNFTYPALMKSVDKGGNLEAAILLPPSEKWNWKELFSKTAKPIPLSWTELQPPEEPDKEDQKVFRTIENWGYETPNNEAVILAPGLPEGKTVYVRLFGIGKIIEVVVKDGLLRFKIPANWNEDTRYEVLDEDEEVIVKGFLNRSGAVMRELSEIDINDESKMNLWFFMNRLRNFQPHRYDRVDYEIPLIPLDPIFWIPGKRKSWSPVSSRVLKLKPKKIFDRVKSNFEEVWDNYYEDSKMSLAVKLRLVIIAMDIYMEGAFYANVLSGGLNTYYVQLGKDLCEFFDLPCAENCRSLWSEGEWKKNYLSPLDNDILEVWRKIGGKVRLDISLLFNFWLYFNSRTVGAFQAFNRRSLDVPININRFFQIFKALRLLIGKREENASFQKVWDNRTMFLKSYKQIQKPSDFQVLERLVENCYERTRALL